MKSKQVVNYIAILDLIAVARKSAIDRQGVYTEIPINPIEQSLWISKIFRKYAKQLFPNCYIRRNKYSFSVRLDNPIFSEMYIVTRKGIGIDTEMYQDPEEKRWVSSLFNTLQESIRSHRQLCLKIRDDEKMFLYLYHQRDVYRSSRGSFMGVLTGAEEFSRTWQELYKESFPRVKEAVERALLQVEESRRVSLETSSHLEEQEQPRRLDTVILRPINTTPPMEEEVPAPTVSQEAQNQFNEILRRVSNRNQVPEEIEEEIIITLDEPATSTVDLPQLLRMTPNDYIAEYGSLDDLGFNLGSSEAQEDKISRILNTIELPKDIPTVNIPFDKEYVFDVSSDIETALTEGPDGIYYVPDPLYYIAINGKIVDTKENLEDAYKVYFEHKGDISIPILYPVTKIDMDSKINASKRIIPSDVAQIEHRARRIMHTNEHFFGGGEND